MGLFVQDIHVSASGKYLVEKQTLPKITKSKIDFYVAPGSVALVGGQRFKGQGSPYELTSVMFGSMKSEPEVFVYEDKSYDSINVNFFAGQYEVCLSAMKTAKAKFSIVGSVTIEIGDFRDLARYFGRSITREDLVNEVNTNYRNHLGNEVASYAGKYITEETTEITLQGALNNIVSDVMSESRKTSSMLYNMGLLLSKKGVSLHLNSLDDADAKIQEINDALARQALDQVNDPARDRAAQELEKEREHEINRIRAENTKITETYVNDNRQINNNGTAPVTINEHVTNGRVAPAKPEAPQASFCPECGAKITSSSAKFCTNCGHKLK